MQRSFKNMGQIMSPFCLRPSNGFPLYLEWTPDSSIPWPVGTYQSSPPAPYLPRCLRDCLLQLSWFSSQLRCCLSEAFLVHAIKNNFSQCHFETHYPVLSLISHQTCHYIKMSLLFPYLFPYLFAYVLSVSSARMQVPWEKTCVSGSILCPWHLEQC